jgi:AcrR family transcriptional regulator
MTPVKTDKKRRTYGGLAPEERARQRRERLIHAGIEAFGTRGYHAVTVREICAEAELTERYFYESFASLEKLFAAVYAAVSLELRQATLAVLGKPFEEPLELAEASLRAFFEFVENDPRRARILLVEAVAVGEPMQRFVYQNTRDYAELLRSFIELLTPEAASAGLKPELLSTGLIGANIYIAAQWFREGFRAPLEEVLHNTMALYRAVEESFRSNASAAARKRPAPRKPVQKP